VTTVKVYTTIVVPCKETTGVLSGSVIPSSSTTTIISTNVVVPQVVFQTITGTSSGAVLVTGAPAIANAGVATVSTASHTTFAVSSIANGTIKASSTPTHQTTSSAGKNTMAFGSILAAVFFAVMIL
jgi:hypothetical protein